MAQAPCQTFFEKQDKTNILLSLAWVMVMIFTVIVVALVKIIIIIWEIQGPHYWPWVRVYNCTHIVSKQFEE